MKIIYARLNIAVDKTYLREGFGGDREVVKELEGYRKGIYLTEVPAFSTLFEDKLFFLKDGDEIEAPSFSQIAIQEVRDNSDFSGSVRIEEEFDDRVSGEQILNPVMVDVFLAKKKFYGLWKLLVKIQQPQILIYATFQAESLFWDLGEDSRSIHRYEIFDFGWSLELCGANS